jgi:hypothetical protein
MTIAAAKTLLQNNQGGSDPIIGFSCNTDPTGMGNIASCDTDTNIGNCYFIRRSKTPLPYPNWPNNYGCTWLRGDINPGW